MFIVKLKTNNYREDKKFCIKIHFILNNRNLSRICGRYSSERRLLQALKDFKIYYEKDENISFSLHHIYFINDY